MPDINPDLVLKGRHSITVITDILFICVVTQIVFTAAGRMMIVELLGGVAAAAISGSFALQPLGLG